MDEELQAANLSFDYDMKHFSIGVCAHALCCKKPYMYVVEHGYAVVKDVAIRRKAR